MAKKKVTLGAASLQRETDRLARQAERTKKQLDKTIEAADYLAKSQSKSENINRATFRTAPESAKR